MLSVSTRRSLRLFVVGLVVALVAAMLSVGASSASAATTGFVRGTVTSQAADFDPTDVYVTALQFLEEEDEWGDIGWVEVDDAYVNRQGRYVLSGLAPGTYRIAFSDESAATRDQFWNNKSDIEDADDVVVTSGQTVTGIDAALVEAPKLVNSEMPTITGSATPGSTLKATSGTWTPAATYLYYEWLVDGVEADVPSRDTFTAKFDHLGKMISVRVYAYTPGFRPAEVTSSPVIVAPVKASNLIVQRTATRATFTWNLSPGATSYRVTLFQGAKQFGPPGNHYATYSSTARLQPNKTYTVKVEAMYDNSYASAPIAATFTTKKMQPATGIKASSRTDRSAMIAWPSVEGAKYYQISYRTPGKATKTRRTVNRGIGLSSLKPATKYTVQVTTFAADGTKAVSKKFTFTTRKAKK